MIKNIIIWFCSVTLGLALFIFGVYTNSCSKTIVKEKTIFSKLIDKI